MQIQRRLGHVNNLPSDFSHSEIGSPVSMHRVDFVEKFVKRKSLPAGPSSRNDFSYSRFRRAMSRANWWSEQGKA